MSFSDFQKANWSRYILIFLFLLMAAVLVRNAWLCDDAYISFRVVDNLVHGYGLTWNTDERVQAFTNPLWVLLLSVFYAVTGEIYFTSIFLSIVLSFLAVMIIALGIGVSRRTAIVTILMLIFSKAFIDYTTSGLENPLTYLLLALFFRVYYRYPQTRKTFFWLCILASLGMVNRMDTALLYLPPVIYYYFAVLRRRGLHYAVAGFMPFIVWELFALIYYGFPFPNTYYAKLHTGIPAIDLVFQGMKYFLDTLLLDPLTLLIITAGLAAAWFSKEKKTISVAVGILIYFLYILKIGGDFMTGRFFAAPFLCAVALIAYVGLPSSKRMYGVILAAIVLIGISLPRNPVLSGSDYGTNIENGYGIGGIADERVFYYPVSGLIRAGNDELLKQHTWYNSGEEWRRQGVPVVQTWSIGFTGFAAGPDVHIIDNYALADPLMARLPLFETSAWRIGHFGKIYPRGYMESIYFSRNLIADSGMAIYYEKLNLLNKGEIFDLQRFVEIWKFNTGQYDHFVDNFRKNGILEVNYSERFYPKPAGNRWDRPDNYIFRQGGMILYFGALIHNARIEVSPDNTDNYTYYFYNDTSLVFECSSEANKIPGVGLRVDTLLIPDSSRSIGYNRIVVLPGEGDGRYSVGHFRLIDLEVD